MAHMPKRTLLGTYVPKEKRVMPMPRGALLSSLGLHFTSL
jgi:hypothetical protein